jgi:hypothetical protein
MNPYIKRMKVVQKLVPVLAIAGLLVYSSCYKDNIETLYPTSTTCDTTTSTYATDIQPIVSVNCATSGCHDASTASGGYALDTYAGVETIVYNGRLLGTIQAGTMPKSGSLSACSINKITRWVNLGALNN